MPTLSIVIITYNEAHNIRRCLDATTWADEVVIVDSGSTDNTVEICKTYTQKIIETDWPGFGQQKNRAIDAATCDWVLVLDADEVITPPLRQSITTTCLQTDSTFDVYEIKRKSRFIGRLIQHGDWGRDRVTRLFKRGTARYDHAHVHEKLCVDRPIGQLKGTLEHHTVQDIAQALDKLNTYSSLSAQSLLEQHRKTTLLQAYLHGRWTFIRAYIFRLGFLDGRAGFMVALLSAQNSFYKYAKALYHSDLPNTQGN